MNVESLTTNQAAMLEKICRYGPDGATFHQLGIRNGSRSLPDLIFGGLVEYIPKSEPWRYRTKLTGNAEDSA